MACILQDRLEKAKVGGKHSKDYKLRHSLVKALSDTVNSFRVYDDCYNNVQCDVWPQFKSVKHYEKHCKNKNHGKTITKRGWSLRKYSVTCVKNCQLPKCDFDVWEPAMDFHKKNHQVEQKKDLCKRLTNMDGIATAVSKFLSDKEFHDTSQMCVPEHMNLYDKNAVMVHVATSATDLQFEVLETGNDAFLSGDDMTYDSTTKVVETIYDCSTGGFAEKRCKVALEECENDKKTTNTVIVKDENGALMSTCDVWVKGVKYGLSCTDSLLAQQRRRRLFQLGGGQKES